MNMVMLELHHALCRRHRHHHRPAGRRDRHQSCCRRRFRALKDYQDLVYGAALILILIYVPGGLPRCVCSAASRHQVAPASMRRSRQRRRHEPPRASTDLTRHFDGLVAVDSRDRSRCRPRASIRGHRPERRRQDDVVQHDLRLPAADRRPRRVRRRGHHRRRPATIAARGLIRTFQLVQLFQNLTVARKRQGRPSRAHERRACSRRCCGPAGRGARRQETERSARELIDFVGLGAQAELRAAVLPYGQQRLLEIARALAAAPKLLLLDEPAAGLNHEETTQLCRK